MHPSDGGDGVATESLFHRLFYRMLGQVLKNYQTDPIPVLVIGLPQDPVYRRYLNGTTNAMDLMKVRVFIVGDNSRVSALDFRK